MNKQYYQKMYNTWKSINSLKWERAHRLEEKFKEFIIGVARKQFPKRKINDLSKAFDLLGEEKFNELKAPWMMLAKDISDKYKKFEQSLEQSLKDNAENYEIVVTQQEPTFKIKESHSSSYSSQGWGASKYAKGYLEESLVLLRLLGYNAEIIEIDHHENKTWSFYTTDYALMANITELDFQVLKWKHEFISMMNWMIVCWRNGVNPKVYFPFIDNDEYDRSQKLARDTNYVITKDNMKTEPKGYGE